MRKTVRQTPYAFAINTLNFPPPRVSRLGFGLRQTLGARSGATGSRRRARSRVLVLQEFGSLPSYGLPSQKSNNSFPLIQKSNTRII